MQHKDRWTEKKIEQRLALIEPRVYRNRSPLPAFYHTPLAGPLEDPPIGPDVDCADWPAIEPGSYWGTWMTNFVLRTTFTIPTDWDADAPVGLYLPVGEAGDFSHPEFLAYIDGESYAATDRHHHEFQLSDQWRDGEEHVLALHGWTGLGGFRSGDPNTKLYMKPCALVQIDQPLRDFIATARVALGISKELDANDPTKGRLLNALDAAFKVLDTREPMGEALYASVAPAHDALKAGIEKAGPPMDVDVAATGHAHIDVAWLWTLEQTRRKAGRTFHTVLRLMEQFPDYHFSQSQPQLYDYLKTDYPELLDEIKGRVAEGRWETLGGMWVEADCNITGPESLARQFLLGRTFYKETFGEGVDSPVLWLPDVFGYSWALPQLLKQANIDYFMTIKIGWNQYNRLPYDSFWWQGLDGTKVLTHFSTTPSGQFASTYNAKASTEEAIGIWKNFQQKDQQHELLMAYGYGDGGGGPTREMLENIREMAEFPATPRFHQRGVGDFFRNIEAEAGEVLPEWNGELYLEYHRGTYTTQARNKRANRKSEALLHDAEFLASLATTSDDGYTYPAHELREAWKLVCLNQFHDIIPGSSIGPVYVESLQQYDEVRTAGEAVRDSALAAIGGAAGAGMVIVNPMSYARDGVALWAGEVPAGQTLQRADGTPVVTQATSGGTLIATGELAPYSVNALSLGTDAAPEASKLTATPTLLENALLRVELSEAGDIVRILDKVSGREVLPEGAIANQLQAFEDRPMMFDAWDIDIYYDDKMWLADPASSVRVSEAGPLRATLEVKRTILNSTLTQRISLCRDSVQLDFDTDIDWRERHILLKVAFPVDVLAPTATFDIQWGNVERPTHRNTSWDWARFESCAQKWVDLSEGGYGVSLLNDCKYGHDVRANVLRMTLLRSPTMPDPEADRGEHSFAYSLLPHAGGWDETTVAAAYALNDPLIAYGTPSSTQGTTGTDGVPFVSVDQPNVVIETVKRAEDGNGVIVRMYECRRMRGAVTLTTGFDLAEAWHTNLLEEAGTAVGVAGRAVTFDIKPYEIVTLRLIPA